MTNSIDFSKINAYSQYGREWIWEELAYPSWETVGWKSRQWLGGWEAGCINLIMNLRWVGRWEAVTWETPNPSWRQKDKVGGLVLRMMRELFSWVLGSGLG